MESETRLPILPPRAEIALPLTDILKSTEFEEKFGRAFSKKAQVELV